MTTLGQMLFENGMKEGMARGREEGIATGLVKGRAEGMATGMEKSMVKIVTTMLSRNKTVEEIHYDTDIAIPYIQKIKDALS